jgi:hypothetical protein
MTKQTNKVNETKNKQKAMHSIMTRLYLERQAEPSAIFERDWKIDTNLRGSKTKQAKIKQNKH